MKKGKVVLKYLLDYFMITLSDALYAFAFCWFYQPNAISVGGFTGISQVINFFLPVLRIGITRVFLIISLFVLATLVQGLKLLLSSLYSTVISSVFIDLFSGIHSFSPMDDLLLAAAFGGVLAGIGVGMQLRVGATTGGTELAARLLKYKIRHISVGKLCFAVDIIVIIIYAFTFKKINNALYGIASMYIFSLSMDFVIYGGTHAKLAYIISPKSEEIKDKLLEMNLGVTMVDSHGGWNGDEKQMIMCAFKRTQIAAIKKSVTNIDPTAFIIVCEAHEGLGEGFGKYSPDEL